MLEVANRCVLYLLESSKDGRLTLEEQWDDQKDHSQELLEDQRLKDRLATAAPSENADQMHFVDQVQVDNSEGDQTAVEIGLGPVAAGGPRDEADHLEPCLEGPGARNY